MNVFNIDNISVLDAKTVVTVGMFDGVHLGHRQLISHLLALSATTGLTPFVVTFDRHPRQVLDPSSPLSLLSTRDERLALLESCGVPNVAMVHFDKDTASLSACDFAARFLCGRLNMRLLLLGYDNSFGSRRNNDFAQLPQLAASENFDIRNDEAVLMDGIDISSTKIRRLLQQGDIRRANAMLGAPYSVCGTVAHGRHIGTSLGFPTANLQPDDPSKLLPAAGVYALRATIGGKAYVAMANLGTQPTFHQNHNELEVHLLDFNEDIYGCRLQVEFVDRIRDIHTFASPDELVAQLHVDRETAISIVNK